MRPPRTVAHAFLPLAAALGLAGLLASNAVADDEAASRARPTIYRWVDADGVAHYTASRDRVPSGVRGTITELQPAPPPAPGETGETGAAAAGAAAAATSTTPASPDSSWATQNAVPLPAGTGARATRIASRGGSAPDTSGLDARIAELEAEIARDEDTIKDFLSAPPAEGATPLPDTPEFREIARRLPRLQAELRGLRDRRGRAGGSGGASDDGVPLGSGSDRDDR